MKDKVPSAVKLWNKQYRMCPDGYKHPEIIEMVNDARGYFKPDPTYRHGQPLTAQEVVHAVERALQSGDNDELDTFDKIAKFYGLPNHIIEAIAKTVLTGETIPWKVK